MGRPGVFLSPGWPVRMMRDVVDDRDLEIIAALQEDARATYADVGRRVGLSPSSVHERVRKLEETGVIRSYRAVIDPEALGLFVTALVAVTPLDPRSRTTSPSEWRISPRWRIASAWRASPTTS